MCVSISEHAQVLDDVRVSYGTHKLTLLLKVPDGKSVLSLRQQFDVVQLDRIELGG